MRKLFSVLTILLVLVAFSNTAYASTDVPSLDSVTLSDLPGTAISFDEMMQVPADVDNPSGVQWTASVDHATITSYELDILRPDSTVLQTINAGKPAPDASNTCTTSLNVQPVAFAVGYSVRVRAVAGTAFSAYSLSQNKFNRIPGGPSKVIIKEPVPPPVL